jgi:hypothetical protein
MTTAIEPELRHWRWVPGRPVPTYSYRSLVAVYHQTVRSYADYRVYPASLPVAKRRPLRALCVGGLPSRGLADQIADRLETEGARG